MGDRLALLGALAILGYAEEGVDNSTISSGLDFWFFLPYLIWSPIAGLLADRMPRKWIMFAADELRSLIMLLGWLMIVPLIVEGRLPEQSHWMIWWMIGGIGFMAATFVPAKLSVVPNVVAYGELSRANAVVVCMGIIGNLMGFFIGGALAKQTPATFLIFSALAYGISGLFWPFLRISKQHMETQHPHNLKEAFDDIALGLTYAKTHRPILFLIATAAIVWTGTSIYMPALQVVNVDLYHRDFTSMTQLMGALGLGMLLGSVAMGAFNTRLGSELFITLGLGGCGLFIALQMIVPSVDAGLAIAFITGLFATAILVPINTMLQRLTPDYIRGRVFASKEILTEVGKVLIAFALWKAPNTDPIMRPLGVAIGVILLIAAIYGLFKFVLKRGPGATYTQNFLYRFNRLYTQGLHRLRIEGARHVPRQGAVIFASNHTAGLDPALIHAAVPRSITWMMTTRYIRWPFTIVLKAIAPIGVKRDGKDIPATRAAIEVLSQGHALGFFPEGRINRTPQEGLLPFGDGAAVIAKRASAPIVPVFIEGTPRGCGPILAFFIPSRCKIRFGAPFNLTEEMDREEATQRIQNEIESLRDASKSP